MSGNYDFENVIRDITPERLAQAEKKEAEPLSAVPLREIRKALSLTQRELATTMNVNQPAVAKLENRADMHVSNLRRYIEALGGNLGIVAKFPQGDVIVDVGTDRKS